MRIVAKAALLENILLRLRHQSTIVERI